MMMEFALKAVKLGGWGFYGHRVGAAQGLHSGRERVTICGGGGTYGASLRLARVACSESAQSPAPPKRKKKVETRTDGPTKPELKLVRDLQEFVASCNLPTDSVPTAADLAKLGRPDLASRVRRKGYKQVVELLEKVRIADSGETTQNEGVTVPPNRSVASEVTRNDDVELSSVKADETVINVEEPIDVGSTNDRALEGLPPSAGPGTKHTNVNGHASLREEIVGGASRDNVADVSEVGTYHAVLGEAAGSTSPVDLFHDDQDTSGDVSGSSPPVALSQDFTKEYEGHSSIEEEYETNYTNDEEDDDEEDYEDDDDDDGPTQTSGRPGPDIAYQKAALLKAKLIQYLDARNEDFRAANSLASPNKTKEKVEFQQEQAQKDLGDIQVIQTFDTPKQLEHLKSLLELRELELSEVSKQLEEARAMLSLARAKATAELVHVKQQTVEQDLRLVAAEQALSHLKKVHLEWWGEANRVEVAGSFNGWQEHIVLEPDFSSEIPKPDGARGPMMWGTHLCLYPGLYEMKFIVDGNWQVDHRREVVMRHTNQNNIVRVE
ncbi:unnamed protein product [Calypogeia fissa]